MNAKWKYLVFKQLPCQDKFLWECNFHADDVKGIFYNMKSKFCYEVIKSWSNYNFKNPESVTEVISQAIWFNSFIKIGKKTIFYRKWYDKGARYIKDLLNGNRIIMSYAEFTQKFNIQVDFVTYYGVICAIPTEWKDLIKTSTVYISEKRKKYRLYYGYRKGT